MLGEPSDLLSLEVDVDDIEFAAFAPHLDARLGEADFELRPFTRRLIGGPSRSAGSAMKKGDDLIGLNFLSHGL